MKFLFKLKIILSINIQIRIISSEGNLKSISSPDRSHRPAEDESFPSEALLLFVYVIEQIPEIILYYDSVTEKGYAEKKDPVIIMYYILSSFVHLRRLRFLCATTS